MELKESQGALHKLKTAIAEGKYLPAEQVSGDLSDFLRRLKQFADRIPARVAGTMSGYLDGAAARAMKKDLQQELDGCSRPLWRRLTSRTVGRTMTRREAPAQGGALRRPPVDGPGPPGAAAQKAAACVGLGRGQPDPARHQRGGGPLAERPDPLPDGDHGRLLGRHHRADRLCEAHPGGRHLGHGKRPGQRHRPGPGPRHDGVPSDQLAKRTVESKLEPMFKSCPALAAKYRAHESEDLAQRFDGMTVYLTGANSPADLSSTPIRYLFLDEVDKYPGSTKKESDPVSLAVERTKSYRLNRKIFMASTPTLKTGLIWRAKEAAEAEKHYFVPCPHCGAYIELKFAQLKWPGKEEEPDPIQRARRARYVCQECGCILTDRDKPAMLRAGRWQFVRRDSQTPRSVAFWMNTLYSPFTTFEEVVREFLKVKDDPEMLHNFVNSWLAEPWEDTKLKTSAELVLERQTETPAWQLPSWTKLLTGGIDVQENSIYWTIRAWGDHMTSQCVAHGQALSGAELEQVMGTVFPLPSGGSLMVDLALMDSGDQTDAIYEFCLLHSDWVIPSKGSSKALPGFYRVSTIDKAGSRANGLQLVLVDTGKYKDMIAARMRRPNGSGSWMVYKGCDLDYAQQVTSEHKVTERSGGRQVERWVVKSTHADNHYLDCEVYAACAADLKNVRSLALQAPAAQPQPRPTPQPTPEEDWIGQHENWI